MRKRLHASDHHRIRNALLEAGNTNVQLRSGAMLRIATSQANERGLRSLAIDEQGPRGWTSIYQHTGATGAQLMGDAIRAIEDHYSQEENAA